MRAGDFAAAWRVSDRVLRERDVAERDDPTVPYHLRWVWDGRPFDGADVLVRCYHGLGDTVQFCRYLPALRQRVRRLSVEAPAPLVPLLRALPGPDRVIPFQLDRPTPPSECDLEIMELAHALRLAPEPAPYLQIAPQELPEGPLHVGVCLSSNSDWGPDRAVPRVLLDRLRTVPGIALHSLQPGLQVDGTECPAEIMDTARLVAGLDAVVSSDTMAAHLAGALGTKLLLLLRAQPDWRWLAGGQGSAQGSVWYADTRKYRQRHAGAWEAPMAAAVADLTRLAARHSVPGSLRRGGGW